MGVPCTINEELYLLRDSLDEFGACVNVALVVLHFSFKVNHLNGHDLSTGFVEPTQISRDRQLPFVDLSEATLADELKQLVVQLYRYEVSAAVD